MGGLLNSLLVQFKGQRAINRLSEDNLIATVLEEQKNGEVDQVALAKAQMEAEGDTKRSDALYIKHRIQRIKDGYYASEAIETVKEWAFSQLQLKKLSAGIYASNIGSIKAFQKCGFIIEGKLREEVISDGIREDILKMGIINPD